MSKLSQNITAEICLLIIWAVIIIACICWLYFGSVKASLLMAILFGPAMGTAITMVLSAIIPGLPLLESEPSSKSSADAAAAALTKLAAIEQYRLAKELGKGQGDKK